MPRKARPSTVRSDGQATKGNLRSFTSGQPNGRPLPLSKLPVADNQPYGEAGIQRSALAQTPVPPGIHPAAHAARLAMAAAPPVNVTPMSAPSDQPGLPANAGAHGPGGFGPPHPMADPAAVATAPQQQTISSILQTAAQASGNPELARLALEAQAAGN